MGRPKKEKPNHGKYYEYKGAVPLADGRTTRKSFYSQISKEDARAQHQQYLVDLEVSRRTMSTFLDYNTKFETWAKQWLALKKPQVDEKTYETTYDNPVNKHIVPYFSGTRLMDINKSNVQDFFNQKLTLSQSMLDKIHMCLSAMFEDAISNDLAVKNPVRKVCFISTAVKNEKRVYLDSDINAVERIASKDMPEVVILLETGLRRGELCGLNWDTGDIELGNKVLHVRRSIAEKKGGGIKVNPPKWDSHRDLPLSATVLKLLNDIPDKTGPVCPNAYGETQRPNSFSQRLERFMKKINKEHPEIAPLTAHELRHTYGTMLRRHGVDIYTIQKLMGHKDIKMTSEIYVENEMPVLQKAIKKVKRKSV